GRRTEGQRPGERAPAGPAREERGGEQEREERDGGEQAQVEVGIEAVRDPSQLVEVDPALAAPHPRKGGREGESGAGARVDGTGRRAGRSSEPCSVRHPASEPAGRGGRGWNRFHARV